MTNRITPVLEALGAIKNLTIEELLPVLQALNEKTKASQDYGTKDERKFFSEGMFDDLITDTRHYMSLRNERLDKEVAERQHDMDNGNCAARLFAHFGDRSNATERVAV